MGKVKAHELRTKSKGELLTQLKELKEELSTLRVAQVTSCGPAKISKILIVRKSIARVLTVHNQLAKSKLREKVVGTKFIPIELRAKTTRAMRRRLTPEQAAKKTLKQTKKDACFPMRKYAVKAL